MIDYYSTTQNGVSELEADHLIASSLLERGLVRRQAFTVVKPSVDFTALAKIKLNRLALNLRQKLDQGQYSKVDTCDRKAIRLITKELLQA